MLLYFIEYYSSDSNMHTNIESKLYATITKWVGIKSKSGHDSLLVEV